ncbi:hypothetical protein [Noviherbaspirillum sp.]|uniref:hypothetical protein n=1 Tax=Noviherbaspirillum sp. TaxID=1926288 RepID=UPI002D4FBB60|nr:hypothetical protein [Noviherbaspirillum sp.]HZW20724.1 hypothetical protein [Noviherbaspirillum sp.]
MKHVLPLPGPAVVNRAVHSMAVIVIILFAFHFARLSGFSGAAVAVAVLVSLVAAASFGLRRTISVDKEEGCITRTLWVFSVPLRTRRRVLAGIAWCGVREDLPDLVIEVGSPDGDAEEVLRFRNGYGNRESEARAACSALAEALGINYEGR